MHFPIFQDIVVLLFFSVAIVYLLQRLKLPAILGFILTGIIIGPEALSLVKATEEVEVLSEIGVILLLFVIGMELSLKQLISIKRTVFIGGFLQVSLMVGVTAFVHQFIGAPWNEAVFTGFLFSLSSTAIVLSVLQNRNEIASPHGKNALGILIFQDIIVVPMMLISPIMAGQSTDVGLSILSLLLKTIAILVTAGIATKYIVPKLLHEVAKTKNKELFLLTTVAICFIVAFLTSEAGLSLALGAFLAGLIISESEYSHQSTAVILPFRGLFTSFFFISVGMLLDVRFFIENAVIILAILVAVSIVKVLITSFAVWVLKYPPRIALLTGLSLFQVGEFAFILSKTGIEFGLISEEVNQYFLSVSILSMVLTPFVIMFSEQISRFVFRKGKDRPKVEDSDQMDSSLKNHLVIIGYGLNGSNLSKAAEYAKIPYVIVELNVETVKNEKKKGLPIYYGDATQFHILEPLNLYEARAVVIAISDPAATKQMIANIRDISPSTYLLVRTRYITETKELLSLGANEVIPEEFETSIEIFSRVMNNFLVPTEDIEHFIEQIRSDDYGILTTNKRSLKTIKPTNLPDFNVTCIRVNREAGSFIGKTIGELQIRANYGVNIMAISRNEVMIYDISSEDRIQQFDLIYVHGRPEKVAAFHQILA